MGRRPAGRTLTPRAGAPVVVKVGGALLAAPARLDAVLALLVERARAGPVVVVVPGGGPFADAVRAADEALAIPATAAHWMAVLAMDQCAELLAARAPGAARVTSPAEIAAAGAAGTLAILAPHGWLRAADPLPHSWGVTSDSIAAWVAGALGAAAVVLVKAAGAAGDGLVDAHFARALPAGVAHAIVPADQLEALALALDRGRGGRGAG